LCRNCLLKHVIEGKLEGRTQMKGRWGRRRKQLLYDLKEKRRYWNLKEEALDRTLWRIRFGRGYGPVVRHTTEWINCFVVRYHCYKVITGNKENERNFLLPHVDATISEGCAACNYFGLSFTRTHLKAPPRSHIWYRRHKVYVQTGSFKEGWGNSG
jgi:hypothetical protein